MVARQKAKRSTDKAERPLDLELTRHSFTRHLFYYKIAHQALSRSRDIQSTMSSMHATSSTRARRLQSLHEEQEMCFVTAVVFSAMSIESFINDYGAQRLGRRFFKDYLDRLDLAGKYLLLPRLATGKSPPRDGKNVAFPQLKALIELRNKLVHHKGQLFTLSEAIEQHFVKERDAQQAVSTVMLVLNEISELDGNISASLLDDYRSIEDGSYRQELNIDCPTVEVDLKS